MTSEEKLKEYKRQWYLKNKERLAEKSKKNYEKNKDERLEKQKKHYQNNKEKIKEYQKEYHKNNKEKVSCRQKEYNKEYNKTPAGIKSYRISNWRKRDIIHDNYDELYKEYIETERCDICGIYLTEDKVKTKTTRCLDHCHETGEVRNIVCNSCNIKRG